MIENRGPDTVQLRSRHWRITNARGEVCEVRGPGVVGEQPRLEPGDEFEYTSGVPLTTPSGIMTGSYQMENGHGESFDVEIPAFSLDSPHQPVKPIEKKLVPRGSKAASAIAKGSVSSWWYCRRQDP